MADFQLNVKLGGVEQTVSTIGELEAALKATKAELKGVEIGGQAFESLSEQARVLQREFKDSFKEATNFEQNLGQITESVGRLSSTITSGFAVAMSAVSLFGGETKDLSEQQIKAQQALTLALSATTIATNAARISEDIRNVGLGIQTGLIKLITLLTGAQTAATVGQTGATEGATVAQRILNATMAANPIGLVVAALATLVAAFIAFSGEAEVATGYVRDYNAEIDRTTKSIEAEIEKQRELEKLIGSVEELRAKTESEKLKIRLDTQKKLDGLDQKSLDNENTAIEQKLDNLKTYKSVLDGQVEAANLLQSAYTSAGVVISNTDQDIVQRRIGLLNKAQLGELEYYKAVIKIRQEYFQEVKEGDQKEFDRQNNQLLDLLEAQKQVQREQEILNQKTKTNIEKFNLEITNVGRDNNKKRLDDLKKYAEDVDNLNSKRVDDERQIQRGIADAELERISLVKGEDGVYREDLIAGFDETIAKLKVSRDRSVEDAKLAFDKEIESFKKTEKEKVDTYGNRIISDNKINEEVAKQTEIFNKDQLERQKTFTAEITNAENDKKNQILQIEEILKTELTFGDNDLSDSRKKIALDQIKFEIDLSNRRIELERSLLTGSADAIKQRQSLQSVERARELAAVKEQINISRAQALDGVVGTETQKAKQRQDINDKADKDILNAQRNFNLSEKEAAKANSDEIFNERVKKLNEFIQIYSQISSTISGLLSSITESNRVNLDNQLNDLRDNGALRQDEINTQYNNERSSLDEKLQSGLISQEQYNNAILSLDTNLAASSKALSDKQKAQENAAKKKAFEEDKKLKIAQAIISGIQGALSAFTGAMQLGPIAGPIVGGILAALVGVTTGIQVNAIKNTKFDSGAPTITAANTGGGAAEAGSALAQASSGGMTQFSSSLVGTPTVTGGAQSSAFDQSAQRVYVVESDITNTQRRVSVLEGNSSFG